MASADSLWRDRDFLPFWAAHAVSLAGTQVTALALPLTAVLLLDASAGQVGLLRAAEAVPVLLISLAAGAWTDRIQRRPLMIAADLSRAAILCGIPLAALCGVLRIELLYMVVFAVGGLSVLFDVAHTAYLPGLVRRERLAEGTAKLEMSRSVAQVAGPSGAGWLIQVLSPPLAILADALSFVASALLLARIRIPEPPPTVSSRHFLADVGEGLRIVGGSRLLRPLALTSAAFNLFVGAPNTLLVLYATRELGLEPVTLGAVYAVGSIGGLVGAVLATATVRRVGLGPAVLGGWLLAAVGTALLPLAGGPPPVAMPQLAAGRLLFGLGLTVGNIAYQALRQGITPDHLLGRVAATGRFISWGTIPLGGLLAGALGDAVGLRASMVVGSVGIALSCACLLRSPVRAVRRVPAQG